MKLIQSPGAFLGEPAFTRSFTSSNQTITSAGSLTLAHGLGSMPKLVQVRLKCTSGEAGYSTGDEIVINPTANGAASSGSGQSLSIVPDATNLNIRIPQATNSFAIANKTTGVAANLTNASWALIFKAWA